MAGNNMDKQFEDYFSELQADMVTISLEYVDYQADMIYIYYSYEPGAYYFNVFYKIDNSILHKHELNLKDKNIYDISIDRQKTLLKIGRKNLKQIHEICKQYNRDMPRSEEHTSELQSRFDLVCRHLLEK